jgi:hypothetical protein
MFHCADLNYYLFCGKYDQPYVRTNHALGQFSVTNLPYFSDFFLAEFSTASGEWKCLVIFPILSNFEMLFTSE